MQVSVITRSLRALSSRRLAAGLVVAAASVMLAACDPPTAAPAVASIVVSPASPSLTIGATTQFTAVGKDASGNVVAFAPSWSVVSGGGTISSTGFFTAGPTVGTYANTVRASSGTVSGSASANVTVGALVVIIVSPSPMSMAIGATQLYTAVGMDAGNNTVAITPTWSVVASGGAINSSTGMFTAGTLAGTYLNTVKATSGLISGTASATVTAGAIATITVTPGSVTLPPNGPQLYTAVAKDASNNVIAFTPTWSVVAGGGAISAAGLFTAGATPGTFTNTVRASSGAINGTASVSVAGGSTLAAVPLGAAGNFVILAKSAISTVPTSAITGDLGLSPAAASFITGFSLSLPAGGAFATSTQVTGNVYASDYAVPTPVNLTTAVSNMLTAYTNAAGRTLPDFTELGSGNIGGLTLPPGLYKWSSTVTIPSSITLTGSATDVWIFQIAGGITQASATNVTLAGGALAKNVFWQVAGIVDIGTTAHMEGVILSQTSITLGTGASIKGRLLAQTAVTLAGATVVQPAP